MEEKKLSKDEIRKIYDKHIIDAYEQIEMCKKRGRPDLIPLVEEKIRMFRNVVKRECD